MSGVGTFCTNKQRKASLFLCADHFLFVQTNCLCRPVVPNWAYSGRIRGSHPRSQPLIYPPTVMHIPVSQPMSIHQSRYGVPTVPPTRLFLDLLLMISQHRPTTTHEQIAHHGDATELWQTRSTPYDRRRFRPHSRLLGIRPAHQEAHSPRPPNRECISSLPHKEYYTEHLARILSFTISRILWASTRTTMFMSQKDQLCRHATS